MVEWAGIDSEECGVHQRSLLTKRRHTNGSVNKGGNLTSDFSSKFYKFNVNVKI